MPNFKKPRPLATRRELRCTLHAATVYAIPLHLHGAATFTACRHPLQALQQLPGRGPLVRPHRPALLHQGPQLLGALGGIGPRLLARHEAVQDLRGAFELVERPLAAAQVEPRSRFATRFLKGDALFWLIFSRNQ